MKKFVAQKKDAFTRSSLDEIAEKFVLEEPNKEKWTPFSGLFKPHHNALTGNYDINVLIATLEDKGKNVVWHDRRNGTSSIDLDRPGDAGLMGVLLNVPVRMFAGVWKSSHWVTLRKIDGFGTIWIVIFLLLRLLKTLKKVKRILGLHHWTWWISFACYE
ncbi:josephin-like protein [Malus domestica]|uniref:josephin-like protein n=1 Tax=Malus domestica TaxID=3750 RepID=UPI003976B330